MQTRPTFYELLKVTSDAPPEVIRAAYRILAQKFHPDRSADAEATETMALINQAYHVLSDPERRDEYDRELKLQSVARYAHYASTSESSYARQQSHPTPSSRPYTRQSGAKEVDLENIWNSWFDKLSVNKYSSKRRVNSDQLNCPPATHIVDLEDLWRNLFDFRTARRRKRGERK